MPGLPTETLNIQCEHSGVSRGFSGCPETPGHDFFLNQVGDSRTDPNLHQALQFATFGTPPPETNSGYATGAVGWCLLAFLCT